MSARLVLLLLVCWPAQPCVTAHVCKFSLPLSLFKQQIVQHCNLKKNFQTGTRKCCGGVQITVEAQNLLQKPICRIHFDVANSRVMWPELCYLAYQMFPLRAEKHEISIGRSVSMEEVHHHFPGLCVHFVCLSHVFAAHCVTCKATAVRGRLMWLFKSSVPPGQVLADLQE